MSNAMNNTKNLLAFDFGASSGRAVLGRFDGEKLTLEELHRFSNDPVSLGGTLYWDVLRLFFEIKQSLLKAKAVCTPDSIGIDTWGVDFGLLDADDRLLENPVHYRDARTAGILTSAFSEISKEELYRITGNQIMEINTAFQLLSLRKTRPSVLERAKTLLFMPDLFAFMLTGEKHTEYSIASTAQLLDAKSRTWSPLVLEKFGIPRALFPDIIPTATPIGHLRADLCDELGIPASRVIAVAGHDTQCAQASVPAAERDFLFLSCGTWSLLGTELDEPLINAQTAACNITNEGGYGGKTSFLKNIIGLWLVQETRRQWQKEGENLSFAEMEKLALSVPAFQCFIDPDDAVFVPAGNIPKRIQEYCRRTAQKVPETKGEILRCIYDSLAMKYRYATMQIEQCTGKRYNTLHIVGGGVKDTLLCRLTADVCGKTVVAGPVEATVFGNLILQLLASGELYTLEEAREVIRHSDKVNTFTPSSGAEIDCAYEAFLTATNLA